MPVRSALAAPPSQDLCGGPRQYPLPIVRNEWAAITYRPARRTAPARPGRLPNSARSAIKLSARNQLKGKIVAVTKGQTTAHVRIDIGGGVIVTSSITNEAVDELALKAGDEAFAVIKASDVMVGE
jgi:molybdopterin-binding protein